MDELSFELPPTYPKEKKKLNKKFIYLIIIVLAIGALYFWFSALNASNNKSIGEKPIVTTPSETPTDTPVLSISQSPTATPSGATAPSASPSKAVTPKPTEKATGLDRSLLSVTIQNGSGEAGVGAKAAGVLRQLGYDVVATDNADNFDYENVTIRTKSIKKNYLDILKKDLSGQYTIDKVTSDLPTSFASDALVIIGK